MNRKTFKFTYRTVVALMLTSIFTFAFVWTRSSASEQVDKGVQNQKATAESKRNAAKEKPQVVALKAEKRGFPLINLQDGKKFQTKFVGANGAAQSFGAAQAKPLTMTNADLNADGAADLIVGYAGSNGGHLAYYQGSLDTLSARTPEIFEDMKEGRFPAPFLPGARLIQLPVAPDFIGTGDFNRDGSKDIIAAQRGSNELYLLTGNRRNSFKIERVEIPGRVTAMLTENIDPLDNAADVAVAVAGENGAALLIYNGAENAFGKEPEIYQLPAEATSLAIGQLDDADPMDILAAGGGSAVIIHGAYPENLDNQNEQTAAFRNGQVENLIQGFHVAAVRVGNFTWDRENRPEIALLTTDGSVRILERGKPNKQMFTEAESKTRWRRHRDEAMAQEAVRKLDYQPRQLKTAREKWTEADNIQISAPLNTNRASSSAAFFTSARMTPFGVEDLLVVDSASRKLHILVSHNEELKETGESYALSASGERAAVTLDVEGTPVAALPMRLSVMNRPGIVFLNEENSEISYSPAAPAVTFNVTKTADTYDGTCNADCSIREALQQANLAASSDLIMIPAGTYTINPALGGPDQDTVIDPAAQQSGDWDVFFDTTITGAGQATTILQAAAAQPGHDRVLDAIQTGVGIPDLTINSLTLANGRCRADLPCVDGGGLRFAVDALAALTISDSTVTNSRTEVNTANPANNGGGIFGGQADYSFTNLTVTNNIAAFVVSGCTTVAQGCGSVGGGAIVTSTNSANPTSLTMNNNVFTGNEARTTSGSGGRGGALFSSPNSVSITNGTFNNNIAGIEGGAFSIFTATTISGATINSNSAATGGGIFSSSGSTLSIANGTVNSNVARSGKGGGIEHSGLSASTVTGVSILNNTGSGILITGAGSLDAATNTITGNSGDGIGQTGTGVGSHFNSNVITNNGELGIDLSDNGVTPNDPNDTDTGPNNLQNFPVINSVRRDNGVANVTLNSTPGRYRIQYYSNTTCDASGNGEGEVLLTSEVVTVPAGNTLTYSSAALAFGAREQITATATSDPNNDGDFNNDGSTSEFSACRQVMAPTAATVSVGGRVTTSSGRGIRNVYITLTDSNGNSRLAVSTTFGYYRFADVPAGETYIISASAKRYTFIQPTQVLNINEDTEEVNFIANSIKMVSDGRK